MTENCTNEISTKWLPKQDLYEDHKVDLPVQWESHKAPPLDEGNPWWLKERNQFSLGNKTFAWFPLLLNWLGQPIRELSKLYLLIYEHMHACILIYIRMYVYVCVTMTIKEKVYQLENGVHQWDWGRGSWEGRREERKGKWRNSI